MRSSAGSSPSNTCVFCRILSGGLTPDVVAFRDTYTAVFPSLHQQVRNRGHMLVVPVRHVAQIHEVDDDLAGPLMQTLVRVAAAVKSVFAADGVTIRQNNGHHGGQDVFHVHFHVVPRFADDGFVGMHRSIELPLEDRIEQARRLSETLASLEASKGRADPPVGPQ